MQYKRLFPQKRKQREVEYNLNIKEAPVERIGV